MSYLEKLLDGVKVEWLPLEAIGDLVRGNGLQKTDFTEFGVPAIHYGQIYTYYGLSTTSTISFVSPETAKKLRKVNTGDVIITNTSENIEDVGKALVYLGEQQAVTGGHATIFKPSEIILGKYFAYFTQTEVFAKEKRKHAKGAKVIDVSATDMAKLPIPIPCPENPAKSLEIQGEIVRILDAFTELTAELIAELAARKKQYSYYRDQLLSFEEGEVEWKTLGEVAKIYDGTHQTPKYTSYGVPFVSVQNIRNLYTTKKFISVGDFEKYKYKPQKDDLFMTRIGDIGTCAVVENDDPLAYYVTLALIRVDKNSILPKFLKYIIESHIGKSELYKRTLIHAVPIKINLGEIGKIIIPIPSLTEQARIVAILDKFDALTNSISEGLPREIALRQQQYEYYRDLLFSFPKPEQAEA